MSDIPADAKRILGVNDLRGTPYVDGKPADIFGKGVVFGYADAPSLGIDGEKDDAPGTLTVNAMGADADTITCIHREFRLGTTIWQQHALSPQEWGPWETHDWDHDGFARLHREQEFTEPQIFGKAVVETAVDLGGSNIIDVRLGGVFLKRITRPTELKVIGEFIEGVTSFALHLTDGGLEEVTWWDGLTWPGGNKPNLTPAGVDLLGFMTVDGGLSWMGVVLGQNFK